MPGVETQWSGEGLVPVPGPKARAQPGKKTATLPLRSIQRGWGGVTSCRPRRGSCFRSEQDSGVSLSQSSRVRAANVYSHSSLCATSAQAGATGLIPVCSQLRALSGPCCFNQVYQVLLPLCASELFLFVCFCFLIEINIWLRPRVQTEHLICPQLEKKSFLQTSRGGTIT